MNTNRNARLKPAILRKTAATLTHRIFRNPGALPHGRPLVAVPGLAGLALRSRETYGAQANWRINEPNKRPMVGLSDKAFHRTPFAVSNATALQVICSVKMT